MLGFRGRVIVFVALFMLLFSSSYASYVIYNVGPASNTTYVGSIPYSTDGFSYSDASGNSISYGTVQYVPVIGNYYPDGMWIWMNNGNVPANAIVLQYINGYPIFYCRVQIRNQIHYGALIPNEGCLISNQPSVRFTLYQVLVR